MPQIKNLHLLAEIVKPADLTKMEHAALEHKRHANITFKIVAVTDKKITWEVRQEKSAANNYFPAKRLIEITKETFARFFQQTFQVGPKPYNPPGPSVVDANWVIEKMQQTGTRLKVIADETGLDYPHLSTLVNGAAMSPAMKAVFYYYFLSKEI